MTPCILTWWAPTSSGYGGEAHVTVCHEFHGPKPSPHHEVRHLCGERLCINPEHLRWGTRGENCIDTREHGNVWGQKLNGAQVLELRSLHEAGGRTHQALADRFGLAKPTVGRILRRETWKEVA